MKVVLVQLGSYPNEAPYAAACLKSHAYQDPVLRENVQIYLWTACVSAMSAEQMAASIMEHQPDIVGFSCYTWNWRRVQEIGRKIKERDPRVEVVLGGPEVSPQAQRILLQNHFADFVVSGEGETAFAGLLRQFLGSNRRPELIPGLSYRLNGEILQTTSGPPAEVSDLPSPYLSRLPEMEVRFEFATLETSRGCPFDCKFCDYRVGQKTRWFPLERVEKEIAFLASRARLIQIADADIFLWKERAREIVKMILKFAGQKQVYFRIETNPIFLDDEWIGLLNSRNIELGCGVQSINAEVLRKMARPQNFPRLNDRIDELIKLAPKTRIYVELIYGLPGDTLDGFKTSLDWGLSKYPARLLTSPLLVLPGADMGRRPEDYGLSFDPDPPYRVLRTATYSEEEILESAKICAHIVILRHLDPMFYELLNVLATDLRAILPRPFLAVCQGFFQHLCDRKIKPFYEVEIARSMGEILKALGTEAKQLLPFQIVPRQMKELLDVFGSFAQGLMDRYGLGHLAPHIRDHMQRGLDQLGFYQAAEKLGKTLLSRMKPGSRVLLLGAGALRIAKALADQGINVTTVDRSNLDVMVALVLQRYAQHQFYWDAEELGQLSFPDHSFDAVLLAPLQAVLDGDEEKQLVQKLMGWLKPEEARLFLCSANGAGHSLEEIGPRDFLRQFRRWTNGERRDEPHSVRP